MSPICFGRAACSLTLCCEGNVFAVKVTLPSGFRPWGSVWPCYPRGSPLAQPTPSPSCSMQAGSHSPFTHWPAHCRSRHICASSDAATHTHACRLTSVQAHTLSLCTHVCKFTHCTSAGSYHRPGTAAWRPFFSPLKHHLGAWRSPGKLEKSCSHAIFPLSLPGGPSMMLGRTDAAVALWAKWCTASLQPQAGLRGQQCLSIPGERMEPYPSPGTEGTVPTTLAQAAAPHCLLGSRETP